MVKNHKNEKIEILRLLIKNADKDYSIRQLAILRKINYKSAYEAVMKLYEEGVINIKKEGNNSRISFNFSFNESVFIAEKEIREAFLKNKDFSVLYKRIDEIDNPFFICLVFGSYAKGITHKGSDLDICTITNEREVIKEINNIFDITPFEIHSLEFSSKEFNKMLKSKDYNIGKEIVKNKVILKNIEAFYELIKIDRRIWNHGKMNL
ncbi:MAG: hypothetical protein PWQ87_394 [Candidatus Woesearchaeota archaeon]|nr:hypothetical protein [Candidatus Woesearchaeota archaeon]